MLLGSIVTGPQRAWLSGSPVAQSVIFMLDAFFSGVMPTAGPAWPPEDPCPAFSAAFYSRLFLQWAEPAFYIFLHHFLLENGGAFENSAEILSFMQIM